MWTNTFSSIILALALFCSWGSAGAQCIDYGDYLHWAGSVDTPDLARGVAISGNLACIAVESSGLLVVDISDPTNPQLVGITETLGDALGVASSGNHAFIVHSSGLQIFDISDPSAPVAVGSEYLYGSANVSVSGGLAYIATGSNGLTVVDV